MKHTRLGKVGGNRLNKRIISLIVMGILAIVSIAGLIFAIDNSNKNKDIFASITTSIDKDDISLDIEIDKNPDTDKLEVQNTETRSTYFTITVGGLPDSANRGVVYDSVKGGVISLEQVDFNQSKGITTFKVVAENGGSAKIRFVTISGAREINVNINVQLTAKYVNVAKDAHFGVVKGNKLDLNSRNSLSKLTFYAHEEDSDQFFKPTNYEISYSLKENYQGISITDGVLSVGADAIENKEIFVLANLPNMKTPIQVPVYVFAPMGPISVTSPTAFTSSSGGTDYFDLILNRENKDSAVFDFAINSYGTVGDNYDFTVQSKNSSIVSVDNSNVSGRRTLFASRNLGETTINVMGYPSAVMTINGIPNQKVWFNKDSDADVQVTREVAIRVKNEFRSQDESILKGQMRYSKNELNAFYYVGESNPYFETFSIDTVDQLLINYDNNIEFELVITDTNTSSGFQGIYTATDSPIKNTTLKDILDIRVLVDGKWIPIWELGGSAHYRSQFSVSMLKSSYALPFLGSSVTMTLRAKSVSKLSTSTQSEDKYARCEIPLKGTRAIDELKIDGLNQNNEVALVYNRNISTNNPVTVYMSAGISDQEGDSLWNSEKLTYNADNLPFDIAISNQGLKRGYTFSIKQNSTIEYYVNYPVTFTYPNGISKVINIKIYPYATDISMGVTSDNDGIVYKTIKEPENPEYIRTVYVKIGANYKINVETPGVTVGAQTSFDFDAQSEGLHIVNVTLSAYSDDVFAGRKLDFQIYVIVVNPVRNVVLSESAVKLSGIGAEKYINVQTTLTQSVDNPYENLYIKQQISDENISVTNLTSKGFTLKANYLTSNNVVLGFSIYKKYSYMYDLNGDGTIDANDDFDMQYIAGTPIKINVSVQNESSVTEVLISGDSVVSSSGIGKYISVISNTGNPTDVDINTVPVNADNSQVGLAFAKWIDGRFVLDFDLNLSSIVSANFTDLNSRKLRITAKENVKSLGEYGIAIYAKDSMKLIDGKAQPTTYTILPLYIGTADEIDENIKEQLTTVHDANSGKRNSYGGFNWITKATGNNQTAALFYTKEGNYQSDIIANRYYLDDLKTVLGWNGLTTEDQFTLMKSVNGTTTIMNLGVEGKRKYFEIDQASQVASEVKYILMNTSPAHNSVMEFYAVEGIDRFEVSITGSVGLVARKNLSPDGTDVSEFENKVSVQRGKYFVFTTSTNTTFTSNWKATEYDMSNTGTLSYNGGRYEFIPYITFGNIKFEVTGLKAIVDVNTYGGVDYMSVAQVSSTINGASAGIYDATVKIDRPWDVALLDYWFVYNNVSYPLFKNTASSNISTYISMEGGNAGFLWKLKCLNPNVSRDANGYYTYYLRMDVAIIIESTAVDPFRNIYSAQLILRENLDGLPLVKEPVEKTAYLNVLTQGVTNITFKHFANTVADKETGDLSVSANQTDTSNIYIDKSIVGGVLQVFPTPYYTTVDDIKLTSSEYIMDVIIGQDFQGGNIIDQVKYSIGFTQLIYNKNTKTYQTFLSGNTFKMVSSWSAESGYQWDGVYYFKTFLKYDGQSSKRPEDGTKFTVTVTVKSDGKTIRETMTMYARYKDGIIVTPPDTGDTDGDNANPVGTMVQNKYQPLGTTVTYDISFPTNYVPNYSEYTIHGDAEGYASVTLDEIAKTLTVNLSSNTYSIGKQIEVRVPYKLQGDFVNPYLSVIINPVYYEVLGFEFYNHPENPIQLSQGESSRSLSLRAKTNYNSTLNVDFASKIADFNSVLNSSNFVNIYDDGVGQIIVNTTFSYINGVPVIIDNGDIMREQTFNYINVSAVSDLSRTENQAIGLTKEYNLDITNKNMLNKLERSGDELSKWDAWLTEDGKIDVRLNFDMSLVGKILIIKVFSIYNNTTPEFTLKIEPSYFTYDGYKLKDYPVNPIIALSKSFKLEFEADNLEYFNGTGTTATAVRNAISTFNNELLTSNNLEFSRIVGDTLNFSFNNSTKEVSRIGDVTATSYLKLDTKILYINGTPTLNNGGKVVSTSFTIKTYGATISPEDPSEDPNPPISPSTRVLNAAQAIGKEIRYNIALANVNYDSQLDKNEKVGAKIEEWTTASKWNARLDGNYVVVNLEADPTLFGKTLIIYVYSQEDSSTPAYTVYITPAWFTVDSIDILDHPERPIWIVSPETINQLKFDVNVTYANIPGVDIEAKVDEFRTALNSSSLVVRTANGGILTIIVGLNFVNGQPNIVGISEYGAIIVQSSFDCEMYDVMPGPLNREEAQVIGEEVNYLVNLPNGKKIDHIKALQYDINTDSWVQITGAGAKWSASTDSNRRVSVKLNATSDLIGKKIKIEVYNTEELAFTLNIIPAYFIIENLAVEGQSGQEVWIMTPETPEDLSFVGVVKGNVPAGFGVPAMIDEFNRTLKYSDYITRIYEPGSLSGNLRVNIFVKYIDGKPTIMSQAEGTRIDTTFTYNIYTDGDYKPDYPNLPSEARTRTEVQAIGLEKRYKIDLSNEVAVLTSNLLQGDKWTAKWDNDEIVVTLEPDLDLINKEIKINLYSVFDSSTPIFILTIKPVFFEIVGYEIVGHPETPVRIVSNVESISSLKYRVVTRQSEILDFSTYIDSVNEELNELVKMNDSKFFQSIISDNRFLTISSAIKYNDHLPSFVSIDNNPLNVIEKTFEYKIDGTITDSKSAVQALGTTERYKIDIEGKVAKHLSNGSGWTATIEGDEIVVKLSNDQNLLTRNVQVLVYEDNGSGVAGNKMFTINIKPVWFVVQGFEVANHPERHMWLITPEKISSLSLNVVAKYSSDPLIASNIKTQLSVFNSNLNSTWKNSISKVTFGGEYLTISGAVTYDKGIASIYDLDGAMLTDIVKNVFQYKIYKNSGNEIGGGGVAYPTSPRYAVKYQAVGLTKKYTIDLPDLTTYSLANCKLTEEDSTGVESKWNSLDQNGWEVSIKNNQIEIKLLPDSDLISKKIRVYIYYSADNPNPAFILNINPVWFTVEDIVPLGHPEQPIVVENDGEALSKLTTDFIYTALPEYSKDVAGVSEKIAQFNADMAISPLVVKTLSTNINGKYYLTATTSVSYVDGNAVITESTADVIWSTFEVLVDPAYSEIPERKDVQGIGTSKTYDIDIANVLTNKTYSGTGWTAQVVDNKVTVTLNAAETLVGREISINLDGVFIMKVTPVWFVVEGFDVVGHPESPVWILAPSTTSDLVYRARTNDIPTGLGIENKIEQFNTLLNSSRSTLISETLNKNKFIMLRAAINYNGEGLPEIVRITNDKRNVVEEIIEYYIWADGKVPVPEKPPVMGSKSVNQIIGGSKSYDLNNVNGRLYFQYMWLNGAGDIVNPMSSSSVSYQGASVSYNSLTNKINVQLAANVDYLTSTIEICIPYLVTINNKEVWYSYSLKVKPILFEVYGWGITSPSFSSTQAGQYIYLGGQENETYDAKFVAYVNRTQSGGAVLQNLISQEITKLENFVNSNPDYIKFQISNSGIRNFDLITNRDGSRIIKQLTTEAANNSLIISANISYDIYGVPSVVINGGNEITSEVRIYTGVPQPEPWPPRESLMLGSENQKQAIGTKVKYSVSIPDAIDIFYDEMWFDNIILEGNSDLIKVSYNEIESTITLDIAPNISLMNRNIEIGLPFTILQNGVLTKYYYSFKIDTVLYVVDGFQLSGYPSNLVDLENQDITISLNVKATKSDSASIRNSVNLAIKVFEDDINTMIRNGGVDWKVMFPNGINEPNFNIKSSSGQFIIQKTGNFTGTGTLSGNIYVTYKMGKPVIATENDSIPVQFLISTIKDETPFFPGMSKISRGDNSFSSFPHAIGTSKNYKISTTNANQTFYFRYLEVRNAGPLRGPNGKYEFLDIVWDGGDSNGSISITLKADARLLVEPIEICIPYTEVVEAEIKWYYYSLSIKPVLFEVTGWGIKDGDKIINEIILDDYAVELWFKAKIFSAPLNKDKNQVFTSDDLYFIEESLKALEEQINEYSENISDKFEYMIIHAVPQDGYNVNYKIWRDSDTNKTYIQRDALESSKTIIQLSSNISYQLNNFDSEIVDSAKAVIGLDEDGQMISGSVEVNTTQKAEEDTTSTVIVQDNAYMLSQLEANTDYILMSDIYLSKVMEGGWKPAKFPVGTTLDGNNYKIYIDGLGFNLGSKPTEIGIFQSIPSTSVVKNVQIVVPSENAQSSNKVKTIELDMGLYTGATVSIGLLAGTNSGIITNCAVLSEWQFMENLYSVPNPVTGGLFYKNLKFNPDGYLYDDDYFYQIEKTNGSIKVVKVFNKRGYLLKKDASNNWVESLDKYGNNIEWITPDRTNTAKYENHSAMVSSGDSSARLYVKGTKSNLNITVGGIVGTNNKMITNSRVLIDVELAGPPVTTSAGGSTEISAAAAIVGGFAGTNIGTITASYFSDANVINNAYVGPMGSEVTCYLGGFVGSNQSKGLIMSSYAMGNTIGREDNINFISSTGSVKTIRNLLGGFVHLNSGEIKDCMVNMVIDKLGEGIVGGFVYKNASNASITNCIVNNKVIPIPAGTTDYYQPFIVLNDTMINTDSSVSYKGLTNLKYAGDRQYTHNFVAVLTWLNNQADSDTEKYSNVFNFEGFSIGEGDGDNDWGISDQNTIWQMTSVGPALRSANDIAISFKKSQWSNSDYLYNPGTEKNPLLIWDKAQFRKYVYEATPQATAADRDKLTQNVEVNRQNNHLRMVDNITLDIIPDTYKITYTGIMDGNGLTMDGINLPSVTGTSASIGLFGKLEYATIRNIKFGLTSGGINAYGMRYVGGVAGISINSNFVDVTINAATTSTVIGANIVGGIAGLAVITDSTVENFNITSNVSVTARRNSGVAGPGDALFSSGLEYYQQTLYAINSSNIEQGYGTAGGVFGFVTSNPNNYKKVNANGQEEIWARSFAGLPNQDASMFLKDKNGRVINDKTETGLKYYTDKITLKNVGGAIKNVTANVAGGLIGIMDETIELKDSKLTELKMLTGKYYLGGLVGINLGKISGGSVEISSFNANSVVTSNPNGNYVFRASESSINPIRFWGMTIGAVAAYNDGIPSNSNSGLIVGTKVNVNMLGSNAKNIYVIGGVVGVNGDNGYVDSVVNAKYPIESGAVASASQWQNVGYYFGNIVGRGNVNVDPKTGEILSFTGFEKTRLDLVRKDTVDIGEIYFASPSVFKTPGFVLNGVPANAFGVEEWKSVSGDVVTSNPYSGTRKVQTFTMEEYKSYISYIVSSGDIVDRVKSLEVLYRTLPTEFQNVIIDGKSVVVEKVEDAYLSEFKSWIKDKLIFDKNINQALENNLYDDYCEYLKYSAIGESMEWFMENDNLSNSRTKRYNSMIEFFTYKIKLSGGASGKQNALLSWKQYEDFVEFRDNASTENTTIQDREKYNNTLLEKWLHPYQEFVEYKIDKYGVAEKIKVSNNSDFLSVVDNKKLDKFSSNDPLQGYINYLIPYTSGNIVHESMFVRNESWTMSLAQYYYYVNQVLPNRYGTVSSSYTAEEYANYLYTNYKLESDGTSNLITLDTYMDFLRLERENVMKYEKEWVINGHRLNDQLVGNIGGQLMHWADVWNSEARDKVKDDGSMIYFDSNADGIPDDGKVWEAMTQYFIAKESSLIQLDFTKYMTIRSLGGSLYELIQSGFRTDAYIFYLKSPQYNWTPEQVNFIQNAFGSDQTKFAIAATYNGNVFAWEDLQGARAINVQTDGTWDEISKIWYLDINENGVYDSDIDRIGKLNFKKDEIYPLDGKEYYALHDINLLSLEETVKDQNGNVVGTKVLEGAALYLDKPSNNDKEYAGDKIFSTEFGKDKLVMYTVADVKDADFKVQIENGKFEYYKISRYITENMDLKRTANDDSNVELTNNRTDYLEEALWWFKEGFTAEQFNTMKNSAMQGEILDGKIEITLGNAVQELSIKRSSGYMIADDWYKDYGSGKSGFRTLAAPYDVFTPSDYVTIVKSSKWEDDRAGTGGDTSVVIKKYWTSKFSEYLMMESMHTQIQGQTITKFITEDELARKIGFTLEESKKAKAIVYPTLSKLQYGILVSPTEYADAIAVQGSAYKDMFVSMIKANGTVSEYVEWASNNTFNVTASGTSKYTIFKINHYVFVKANNITESEMDDFKWVLQESNRSRLNNRKAEIMTADLMEYRRDWFNKGGDPYMTFTEYCEWINKYKYNDSFKTDRGELVEGDGSTSGDAWLSIYSYAVWKRMEKYESTTDLKTDTSQRATSITAPLLKRRISTTIMPKIYKSGNEGTLKSNLSNAKSYYGWENVINNKIDALRKEIFGTVKVKDSDGISKDISGGPSLFENTIDMFKPETWKPGKLYTWVDGSYNKETSLVATYLDAKKNSSTIGTAAFKKIEKQYVDKFEQFLSYLEAKNTASQDQTANVGKEVYQRPWEDRYEYNEANNEVTLTTERSLIKTELRNLIDMFPDNKTITCLHAFGNCTDPTHNMYQVQIWSERYGLNLSGSKYNLILDETGESITQKYNQLYIPFAVFKESVQQMKPGLGQTGYENYMKYWAKNGEWNWVYNIATADFKGSSAGKVVLKYGYLDTTGFWEHFNGTVSPLTGNPDSNIIW